MLTTLVVLGLLALAGALTVFAVQRSVRRSQATSIEAVKAAVTEAEWKMHQLTRTAFEAMTKAARQDKAR